MSWSDVLNCGTGLEELWEGKNYHFLLLNFLQTYAVRFVDTFSTLCAPGQVAVS